MTLRLKGVLTKYGVRQSEWAGQIMQSGGKGRGRRLSQAAANLLLNNHTFPRSTPAASIRRQTEDYLRASGVSETDIASIWERDPGDALNRRITEPTTPVTDPLPERDMLTHHAKKHFKLFQNPFEDDVQKPEDVFLSAEQRYIRETLFNTAKHGGFLAVIGESGAGKSVLRRDLIDRIQREEHPITVIQPRSFDKTRLTAGSICEAIIKDVSPEARVGLSLEARSRNVERMLINSSRGGHNHVLIIEEAHDLHVKTLKYLKRFWEMEDGFKKLLAIILIGQPELGGKLDERQNFEAREVIRRCEVAELEPLNGDLKAYLELKFKRVGKDVQDILEADAFDAIRERLTLHRRGSNQTLRMHYPLIVNNTLVKCMNLAAEMGAKRINAEIIKGV